MLSRNPVISALKNVSPPMVSQGFFNCNLLNDDLVTKLLDRRWSLSCPDAKIHQILILNNQNELRSYQNITQPSLGEGMISKRQIYPSFYVVRDDILHPLVNGNKARKLDALLPLLEDNAITDVVTCGGCQSAHTAAVAVSCAERGIKAHLLLRGEEPETLTGYNLVSKLFGNVVYVPRVMYAKREEMLAKHAESVVDTNGFIVGLNEIMEINSKAHACRQEKLLQEENSKKVVIINEGAGDAVALLGVMRLIKYLSEEHLFGKEQALKIVVDAGTGTTAIGLALGALSLGLPWEVCAVMLADKIDVYKHKEQKLITEFVTRYTSSGVGIDPGEGIVRWLERGSPRKFGKILNGEVEECQKVAQETGILVDPIYTLAAWEAAAKLSKNGEQVVMLHTGGTLGMFGIAQRYKSRLKTRSDSAQN